MGIGLVKRMLKFVIDLTIEIPPSQSQKKISKTTEKEPQKDEAEAEATSTAETQRLWKIKFKRSPQVVLR